MLLALRWCELLDQLDVVTATLHRYSVDVATLEHIPEDVIEKLQEPLRWTSENPITMQQMQTTRKTLRFNMT